MDLKQRKVYFRYLKKYNKFIRIKYKYDLDQM